jgi:hypothetical protein
MILTFFDKTEPPRPEIDVKWDSKTHLWNTIFVFLSRLTETALKLVKSANKSKKCFFFLFDMGIMKFDAESESVEKSEQKSPQHSYRQKTILHTVISQKLNFSVTFSLITFF